MSKHWHLHPSVPEWPGPWSHHLGWEPAELSTRLATSQRWCRGDGRSGRVHHACHCQATHPFRKLPLTRKTPVPWWLAVVQPSGCASVRSDPSLDEMNYASPRTSPHDVPRVRGSLQPAAAIACASIASTLLLEHISYPPSPWSKANHAGARAETPAGAHPQRRTQGTGAGIILVRDCVLPAELQATQDTESITAMHDAEAHRCRYRDKAPSSSSPSTFSKPPEDVDDDRLGRMGVAKFQLRWACHARRRLREGCLLESIALPRDHSSVGLAATTFAPSPSTRLFHVCCHSP